VKRIAGAALAIAASFASHAYVYCDDPAKWPEAYRKQGEGRKALTERRFDDLDKYYGAVLAAFEAGRITDGEVNVEFTAFASSYPRYEPLHAEWARTRPRSRAAHLAHAYHWIERGWEGRGGDLASKTSEEQFAAMGRAFTMAFGALDASAALAATPTPEMAKAIRVLQTGAFRQKGLTSEMLYRQAIEKHPRTLITRANYAGAATPHWGGSFARLEQVRTDAAKLSPDDRRYIEWMVDVKIGDSHSFAKDDRAAAKAYERALPKCPALTDASKALLWIYAEAKDYKALIPVATRYLEAYPATSNALLQRGYAYVTLGRYEEAFRDLDKAAQLGDARAYEHLAWMHEWGRGGAKQDYARAIELYMLAHAKGVAGTREKADKIRAATGLK
jgi:tetratricopeptide (TPR) repeat protein